MLKGVRFRWRELFQRDRLDRETRAELAAHVELAVAAKVADGLDPAEARRQAWIELGDPEEARDLLREARTGQWLDTLVRDTTLALRLMRKRPGFATVSLLSIALGVAGSTSLFAVADAVVRKPLPLPDPASLVRPAELDPLQGDSGGRQEPSIDRAGDAEVEPCQPAGSRLELAAIAVPIDEKRANQRRHQRQNNGHRDTEQRRLHPSSPRVSTLALGGVRGP